MADYSIHWPGGAVTSHSRRAAHAIAAVWRRARVDAVPMVRVGAGEWRVDAAPLVVTPECACCIPASVFKGTGGRA